MLKTKRLLTYEDYAGLTDDTRYELLNGELYMVPSPNFYHQSFLRNLGVSLWHFVKENSLGLVFFAPFDVVLTDHDIVQPDIIFVSNERKAIVTEKNIKGAPDILIEILSPGTRERDLLFKKVLYARHGIKEYWIADPIEKNIEVMVLREGSFETHAIFLSEDHFESPSLPGFTPLLEEIFSV